MPKGYYIRTPTVRICTKCRLEFFGYTRGCICSKCKYTCPDCGQPKRDRSSTWCYPCSLSHRDTSKYAENIRKAQIAARSPESVAKLSESLKGHIVSEETRKKISASITVSGHQFEAGRKGGKAGKGKPKSKEWIEKARNRILGPNNPMWKDGSSADQYGEGWFETLKEAIRIRDRRKCQICGRPEEKRRRLDVHHIDDSKTNHSPENLVALCHSCHQRVTADSIVSKTERD